MFVSKTEKKKQKNKSIFPFVIGRTTKQKEKKKLCPVFCFFSFVSFSPCSLRKIKQKKRRDYNNKRWQSVLLLCVSRSKVMRASRVSPLSLSLSFSLAIFTCLNVHRVSCAPSPPHLGLFSCVYFSFVGKMWVDATRVCYRVSAGGCMGKDEIPTVTAESHEDTKWKEMKTNTHTHTHTHTDN